MIIFRRTSLLESSAQTLVNTVNCVGVMGKGLAQAFKERDPDMFGAYKKICENKLLEPGKLWLWRGTNSWVLNFPTKVHWRNPSKIEWIEAGLQKFVASYEAQGITEISFPRLGCGNGGLDWEDVRPIMERYLSEVSIPVYIHDFTVDIGIPEHMGQVAKLLQNETISDQSFDNFTKTLWRAVDLVGNQMIDLESNVVFEISTPSNEILQIQFDSYTRQYEIEELRGLWLKLQKGLVTGQDAGGGAHRSGKPLLSLLSLLPNVRPVQIQRGSLKPEVAIELTPTSYAISDAAEPVKQYEMTWR